MNKLLTIGQVAKRLRVSVDVVRSLTDSGQLKAARTGGGHRRYKSEEVDQFQSKGRAPARNRSTTSPAARPTAIDAAPDDLEVDEDTWEELEAEAMLAEARERVEAERQRLEGIKKTGRDFAKWTILPTEWHAKVNEDLEDFVTTKRFPPSLSALDAQLIVQARVNSFANQYRDAENARQQKERDAAEERRRVEEDRRRADDEKGHKEREAAEQLRKQQEDEYKIEALIEHGKNRAWSQTITGWILSEAKRAREDVASELKSNVQLNWTNSDVDDLVDDVLEDWEEEDDEEENESW